MVDWLHGLPPRGDGNEGELAEDLNELPPPKVGLEAVVEEAEAIEHVLVLQPLLGDEHEQYVGEGERQQHAVDEHADAGDGRVRVVLALPAAGHLGLGLGLGLGLWLGLGLGLGLGSGLGLG